MHTAGETSLPEPSTEPLMTPVEEGRRAASTTFLQEPRLGNAAHTHLEDISILLHLLLYTPDRLIALLHIFPPIPNAEATRIWEA